MRPPLPSHRPFRGALLAAVVGLFADCSATTEHEATAPSLTAVIGIGASCAKSLAAIELVVEAGAVTELQREFAIDGPASLPIAVELPAPVSAVKRTVTATFVLIDGARQHLSASYPMGSSGRLSLVLSCACIGKVCPGGEQCAELPAGSGRTTCQQVQECGDGRCAGSESAESCPVDCRDDCGDGVCAEDEGCERCAADCGVCEVVGAGGAGGAAGEAGSSGAGGGGASGRGGAGGGLGGAAGAAGKGGGGAGGAGGEAGMGGEAGAGGAALPVLASCGALHQAFDQLPSALYRIDPDGDGGIEPFDAFCEMQYEGGGWTLVLATMQSKGPAELAETVPVTRGTATRLPSGHVKALAAEGVSSQVFIRAPGDGSRFMVSVPGELPIRNLRELVLLNAGSPISNSDSENTQWQGPMGTSERLWFNCGVEPHAAERGAYPDIYWSCNNPGGVHLVWKASTFAENEPSEPLEVLVR